MMHVEELASTGQEERAETCRGMCLPAQIVCGNRAGAVTILLDEERRWGSVMELQGEERPHFIARSLGEVQQVLEHHVELLPPAVPPQPLT